MIFFQTIRIKKCGSNNNNLLTGELPCEKYQKSNSIRPGYSGLFKKHFFYFALSVWVFLPFYVNAYASEIKDRIIVLSGIENEQTHTMAKEVLVKAYNQIGYNIRSEYLPGQRSLESANSGTTDGDIARIKGTDKVYPNLIQIETPVINFKGVAFTKNINRKINSWKDLKGLRVGILRGVRYSTHGTKELNPFFANDMTHLFKLLQQDNIEVAVAVLNAGKIEIQKNFKDSGIHATGTPLISASLYHFVHKKNKHLAKDLNNAIKYMADTGEIEKIHKITIEKLLEPKEKIIWPYVCYPPLYICDNDILVDGTGNEILKLIWKQMPEYKHENVLLPIKRILENAKAGEKQLFYGLYKTPEREKFLHYSLPCRISTPTFVIIRKSEIGQFGKDNRVSLKNLLENTVKTFLLLNAVSFGKGIDELLVKNKKKTNVLIEYNTTNMGTKSLKLLINKRVDYILSLDSTLYEAKKLGVSDQLAYLQIKEQSEYVVGHISAPKTIWGEKMINKVNAILKKEIPTESFFQIFKPLVSDKMVPEFKRQFTKKIIGPSQSKGK